MLLREALGGFIMKFTCPNCGKVCHAELDDSEKEEIAAMTTKTTTKKKTAKEPEEAI
jgi:hypothetical protein